MVEQLPYNHIYRNPNYKQEELKVKDSTDKSMVLDDQTDYRFPREDIGCGSIDSEEMVYSRGNCSRHHAIYSDRIQEG